MSELKRTQFYEVHVASGGEMVDFGGWEMPIQYPGGILAEHLYTRRACSLFDVSHMGRILVEGPERIAFLQHVLTSNVAALEVNKAQYCIIPNENGGAIDDAYLNRFEEDRFLLVVNAANKEKDLVHLREQIKGYDCTITDLSGEYAAIAVQGPMTDELLTRLSGGAAITEPKRNSLNTISLEGHVVQAAKTGYTGEPLGYEIYAKNEDALWLWDRLVEMGAKPAGLGARDTLRLEGGLPLYGHEMGLDPEGVEIPIYAVSLAKFAVSFAEEKGDFIGRKALEEQFAAFQKYAEKDYSDLSILPKRIMPIALTDRGVIRAGMPVYRNGEQVGWVTSGTMVPYYHTEGEDEDVRLLETTGKRSIGFCYINSDITRGKAVEVDVRGRRLKAVLPTRHLKLNTPRYAVALVR
ncbi:MAG: glycine cleavage system aminomethyltransferase GcvT [Eubacteriales bacterium]|nr:glycine cleavage system aminomethyltransferase GcvT [Eubacteriales bacterium]